MKLFAYLWDKLLFAMAPIVLALMVFSVFVAGAGYNAAEVLSLLFLGAFGDAFSIQNTMQRAAPLMLTALCVAIPARAGLIVIGGEGALIMGGLACAAVPYGMELALDASGTAILMAASALAGAAWIAIAGYLRQYRGVNETISSLLLSYIAVNVFKHLVEDPMRDPSSLNKPSTLPLSPELMIGSIAQFDVHWGFVWGLLLCGACAVWLSMTTHGFATSVVGGNAKAASLVGIPTKKITIMACALGGAAAGLAGGIEVAAVHTTANASLIAGLGYTGILVSFAARHQPLAIIPMALLLGGFGAGGSLLQRRLEMPDATIGLLLGLVFVFIIAFEAVRNKWQWRKPSSSIMGTALKGEAL